jgi:RNA polymerase sigma-70 factor, ECF subfamily
LPRARGLLALMLYAEARRGARRNARGDYVPLADQDPASWDAQLIDEAEALLLRASATGVIGRLPIRGGSAIGSRDRLAEYQPYWAARAELLARRGDADAADEAYQRAIGLESDPAVRSFLQQRRAELSWADQIDYYKCNIARGREG